MDDPRRLQHWRRCVRQARRRRERRSPGADLRGCGTAQSSGIPSSSHAAVDRLANLLLAQGLGRGDRIGILLPQSPETAIAHVATYKMGMIAVPLFTLFGADALEYRLADSGARALITDRDNLAKIETIRDRLPDLASLIVGTAPAPRRGPCSPARGPGKRLRRLRDRMRPPPTTRRSSSTPPARPARRKAPCTLTGCCSDICRESKCRTSSFPQPGDLFWTPADWAWIGGLIDVLLPAWHHGVPVLAHRMRKFEPEEAFRLMARHGVRNVFMPPTALKLMRQVVEPRRRHVAAAHARQRRRDPGEPTARLGSRELSA